ncbi:helix-turn-helix domain-containing protein [Natronosalvus halobius]|uniref:helix-turn-helix domain-containing protein n=1 Tax=Natronosalvus halobius TaxID=2953746 RepID=UPI0020A0E593|nr:helix-turn-helix domain-containing protein [Natronosalvus halobius]USZ72203.1 helix-turn-helix domain-containing protein [Natronosalvus halobius]
MSPGIRATVKVGSPEGCPIASFSQRTGTTVDRVSTSTASEGNLSDSEGNAKSTTSTTEFLAATDEEIDDVSGPIFSYGSTNLYRHTHDDSNCPCACLGSFGCPVHRYVAEDGDLTLVFHAEHFDQLQAIMAEFRERYPDIDVQRLLQPPLQGSTEEQVFVNRGKLTDRQHEVLQAAYDAGYFERPKGANATEIAAELDISQSTFTEHLVAAQRKLFEDILETDA